MVLGFGRFFICGIRLLGTNIFHSRALASVIKYQLWLCIIVYVLQNKVSYSCLIIWNPNFQMRRPEKIWYSSRVRVVLHHWVFLASTTPLINGLFGPPIIYTRSDIERSAFAKKQKLFYFSESLGIDHSCINILAERFFLTIPVFVRIEWILSIDKKDELI